MLKPALKRALGRLGWRVSRTPPQRFDGMDEVLAHLARLGYAPAFIVDAGANRGQWARRARRAFPRAAIHLIEPQSTCAPDLAALAASDGNMLLHRLAVTAPGVSGVRIVGTGPKGGSTGAFIPRPGETGEGDEQCAAATLDALFATQVAAADRTLLKLDLEGHELPALEGAERLLRLVEVIVAEVQFYDANDAGRARFTELLPWLGQRGFQLFDFAALASRPRDGRLRSGDVVFVRDGCTLAADRSWA